MNVTDENVEEVAAMLALVSSQTDDITTNGLENFIVTLDSIVQVGSPSFEVRHFSNIVILGLFLFIIRSTVRPFLKKAFARRLLPSKADINISLLYI